MSSLIEVRHLHKEYPLRDSTSVVHAVNDVSFEIERGTTFGLCGESGSGKTTVGRCIIHLLEPTSGQVLFDGRDLGTLRKAELRALRPKLQVVFQDPFDSLNPRLAVGDIVEEPMRLWAEGGRSERRRRVLELLDLVGLERGVVKAYPHKLGGGEAQRVAIARALASEPEFIVLDEITSSLDPIARGEVIEVLTRLRNELGLTYLLISHDLNVVRQICDRVAVMYLGKIVEVGSSVEIFASHVHPYSRALLSSVLHADPTRPRVPFDLEGEIPSPIDLPDGCFLHGRCPVAMDMCRTDVPELSPTSSEHLVACFRAKEDPAWATRPGGLHVDEHHEGRSAV